MDYFITETMRNEWCGNNIPTEVQIYRWYWMKDNILNPIREHIKTPIKITNCLRSYKDYERLKTAGYNPSPKSDHFAGNPIELTQEKHIVQFGKIYYYSTFACDIIGEFDYKKLCRDIFLTVKNRVAITDKHFIRGLSKYGVEQLIIEAQKKDDRVINWIHIAAPLEAFWSENEAKIIRRIRANQKFLEYKSGQYVGTKFE